MPNVWTGGARSRLFRRWRGSDWAQLYCYDTNAIYGVQWRGYIYGIERYYPSNRQGKRYFAAYHQRRISSFWPKGGTRTGRFQRRLNKWWGGNRPAIAWRRCAIPAPPKRLIP